jgi:hypothetical protein
MNPLCGALVICTLPSGFKLRPDYKNNFSVDPIHCFFFASPLLFLSIDISVALQTMTATTKDEQTLRLPFSASYPPLPQIVKDTVAIFF